MDIISLNEAATANSRIEKFINEPDSNSGIVTVPKVIASGETITIPAGRVAILPNVQIDGVLNVEGEVFIPSGATLGDLDAQLALKAPLASPSFTGTPTAPVPSAVNQLITMGNIIEKTGAGIGYGAGSGGTVTQLTSKSTLVTLNKPTGKITTSNSALAAGATAYFTFGNSLIGANDFVNLQIAAWAGDYRAVSEVSGNGTCFIFITNLSGASLSDAVPIKFNIIKGAIS